MNIGESATLAMDHLFTTNEDNLEKLSKEETITFHHVIEKLLYLDKRSIPDLQPYVTFIFTRVKDPDKYDCNNLTQIMKYIWSTIGLSFILGIDDTTTLRWYVDSVFRVHCHMKSHTRMMPIMGQETDLSNSTKPILNTNSWTRAYRAVICDEISPIIWSGYFLEEQGY